MLGVSTYLPPPAFFPPANTSISWKPSKSSVCIGAAVKNRTKQAYSQVLNLHPHQALSRQRFHPICSSVHSLAGLPWSAEEYKCTESISGPLRARLPTQCCREPLISSQRQRSEIPQVCTMGFLCVCTSHEWERGLHTQTKNSSIYPSTQSEPHTVSAVTQTLRLSMP